MFGLDEIYKFKLFLISFIYLPPPPPSIISCQLIMVYKLHIIGDILRQGPKMQDDPNLLLDYLEVIISGEY